MPYVYQLANKLAAMDTRYAKMGTPTARTNAAPFARIIRMVHVVQPRTVCSCRWRVRRNKRMKNNFAAVCEYKEPAMRKFGRAMPYYSFPRRRISVTVAVREVSGQNEP